VGVLRWIVGRLTYANVIATLALFIALGGASYAVTELPAHSVGTRQLKQGAVTPGALGFPLGAQAFKSTGPITLHREQCSEGPPGICAGVGELAAEMPLGSIRLRAKATVALTGVVQLTDDGPPGTSASVALAVYCGGTTPPDAMPSQSLTVAAGSTVTIPLQAVVKVPGPLAKGTTAARNVGIRSTSVHFSTRDPAQLVMQTASVDATIVPG
jgi:hypothetical protein